MTISLSVILLSVVFPEWPVANKNSCIKTADSALLSKKSDSIINKFNYQSENYQLHIKVSEMRQKRWKDKKAREREVERERGIERERACVSVRLCAGKREGEIEIKSV